MTGAEILDQAKALLPMGISSTPGVIFTGGEPGLQLDGELVGLFHGAGFFTAVESNGTRMLPSNLDWICISPKSAEHTLVQQRHSDGTPRRVDELKYVRHAAQSIPKPTLEAQHYLLSPAFTPEGVVDRYALQTCIELVKLHPQWRLSCQLHKWWRVR